MNVPHDSARRINLSDATAATEDEGALDIRGILQKVWRGKFIIAVCLLVALVMSYLTVSQFVPEYRATAKVMFGLQGQSNLISAEPILQAEARGSSLQNQIEVLQSTSLIERVVDRLDLVNDPTFNPLLRTSEPGLLQRMRQMVSMPPELADLLQNLGVKEPASQADPERKVDADFERRLVIASVRSGLWIRPVDGSRVINLSYTSGDPIKSAELANTFAEQYIVDQLEARLEATQAATSWLSERVEELKDRVQTAERAVETEIAKQSLAAGQSLEITRGQLASLNVALSSMRAQATSAESLYQRLQAALDEERDYGAILEFRGGVISAQRAREAELLVQIQGLENTVATNHPALVRVRNLLAQTRANIEDEAKQIVEAERSNWQAKEDEAKKIEQELRTVELLAQEQSSEQVQIRQLQREAEASRALYSNLLTRLTETSEQEKLQTADARILSPAEPPFRPLSIASNRTQIAFAVLGTLIGLGIVFLLDKLNNTFRSPSQLSEMTGEPVLGVIPGIGKRMERNAILKRYKDKPKSSLAEAIRNLRTSILFSNVDNPPKVVMFTSSVTSEGKSTTSMLIATTSQQMGKSAIIVDCDLRLPSLAELLDAKDQGPGLLSVLDGTATVDEAVYKDPDTGLHVLMTKPSEPRSNLNAADILSSNRFKELIAGLREQYDLLILDSPPTLAVADARILSEQADAVVYVVRWDHTPRGAVLEGLKEMKSMRTPLAGVVLTMVNETKATRFSYDGYNYYRGQYKDYYVS